MRELVFHPSPHVLAPDWRSRLFSAPATAWIVAIVLLVVGTLRDPSLQGWLYSVGAVAVVIVVPILLARVNARLVLSPVEVEYRGMLRVGHHCRRRDVAQLVRVSVTVFGSRIVFKRLLLVSGDGEALLSIQEDIWSPADLQRLCDELAAPLTVLDEAQSPSSINRRFPGAASFGLAHLGAISLVGAAIAIVTLLGVLGAHTGGH